MQICTPRVKLCRVRTSILFLSKALYLCQILYIFFRTRSFFCLTIKNLYQEHCIIEAKRVLTQPLCCSKTKQPQNSLFCSNLMIFKFTEWPLNSVGQFCVRLSVCKTGQGSFSNLHVCYEIAAETWGKLPCITQKGLSGKCKKRAIMNL